MDEIFSYLQIRADNNLLCALATATSIPSYLSSGAMLGWDWSDLLAASHYCIGWTRISFNPNNQYEYPNNSTVAYIKLSDYGITGSIPPHI
jgi:hypothetical protein